MHDQQIAWFRLDPSVNVGLGKGWQVSAGVPFDLRLVTVQYETLDGAAYDPPYDDIHHRNEAIAGPVDGTALVRKVISTKHFIVGAGVGTTLPIGKTEEDPFALTEAGLAHQHSQLGTGTFVPLASVDVYYAAARWGALGFAQLRLPLYENDKGYRPPASATLGVGPSFRILPPLQVIATAEGAYDSAEYWHDTAHGGRLALVVGVGGIYSLSPHVVVQAQARFTPLQHAEEEDHDAVFVQPVVATIGVSWTLGSGVKPAVR